MRLNRAATLWLIGFLAMIAGVMIVGAVSSLPDDLKTTLVVPLLMAGIVCWIMFCAEAVQVNSTLSLLESMPAPVLDPIPDPVRRAIIDPSGYVYLIHADNGLYKIGSTADPDDRMRTFKLRLPFDVEYEHLIETEDRGALERLLHRRFASKRINKGEWFRLDDEDVAYIKSLGGTNGKEG